MWILVIIAVFAFLALCGLVSEKQDKGKSSEQLIYLKKYHKISLSFVSQTGLLAFCDDEKKIYNYINILSKLEEIEYSSILKFEKNSNINGSSFWALTPTYTEYISGDIGSDKVIQLNEKLSDIIETNISVAESKYSNITIIPNNASRVTIKCISGQDSSTYITFNDRGNYYVWTDDNKLIFLPKFNFIDYKLKPNIYKLLEVEKENIVDICQEGAVHYTTEVNGGGGGGSSVTGAIIGGIIAGDAGAIIGSRKPTEPITSTTKQIDDRSTKLKIVDTENNFFELVLGYNDYYVLSKMIVK